MTIDTYSSATAAQDATEYAIALNLLDLDPDDLDAQATIDALDLQYGRGFFGENE